MGDKIKSLCEKIINEFEIDRRGKILKEMIDAVKRYEIDISEESLRVFVIERIKHYENTHTFSINNCPRILSSTIKEIAKRDRKIPSDLVISIMMEYIKDKNPEMLNRIEALIELEKGID